VLRHPAAPFGRSAAAARVHHADVWAWIGIAAAAIGGLVALRNARSPARSFYAAEVYGMSRRSHTRFALLSGAFVAAFLIAAFAPIVPAVPILAVYTLLVVLYAASFARGFSDP
jgi:hypothetical protein